MLFWMTPGKLQLLDSIRQNPHELRLEVWEPRAVCLIGLRSRTILPLRGRNGHRVIPLLLAKGHKLLDISRRAEAVLWEGNKPYRGGPGACGPAGLRNVCTQTRPASPWRGPSPGRRRSDRVDPAVLQYWSRVDLANCSHNEFSR